MRVGDEVFADLIWTYPDPIAECPKIRGLVCFFQEREATLSIDGKLLATPTTRWSR